MSMKAKLVRDKIPESKTKVAGQRFLRLERKGALHRLAKMHEEVEEIADNPGNIEEYADLYEAFTRLAAINGFCLRDIAVAAQKKRIAKGGFSNGTVMHREVKQ